MNIIGLHCPVRVPFMVIGNAKTRRGACAVGPRPAPAGGPAQLAGAGCRGWCVCAAGPRVLLAAASSDTSWGRELECLPAGSTRQERQTRFREGH